MASLLPVPPAAAPAAADSLAPGDSFATLAAAVARAIHGKGEVVRLALAALVARGHILIEDVPGVGKTTLARAIARALGGSFRRIQFTSDLLPSDILGVSIFDPESRRFELKRGPIFANVVLADEINRSTPRTQSSLLEAMNEGRVTLDGQTHLLEPPFLVIATQNPLEHFGTYPLPESQMDRFLVRLRMGYPAWSEERQVVTGADGEELLAKIEPVVATAGVAALQAAAARVKFDESLLDYAQKLVAATRQTRLLALGVSPRGFQGWYRLAKAYALGGGRNFVVPDDLKETALPALAHRLVLAGGGAAPATGARDEAETVLADLLERVPVPL